MKYTPGRWAVCTLGSRGGSCCGQAGDEQREGRMGLQALCAGAAGACSTSPMGSGGISSDSTARGFAPLVINGNYSASYAVIQGNAQTKRASAHHLTYQKMPGVRKNCICIMTYISTQAFQQRKAFCLTTEERAGCQALLPLGQEPTSSPHLPPLLPLLHRSKPWINNGVVWLRKTTGHRSAGLMACQQEGRMEKDHTSEQQRGITAAQLPFPAVPYSACVNQEKSFNLSHLLFSKMGYWYIPSLHGLAWLNP